MEIDFKDFGDFLTALLIGAMIGIEREKRKAEENDNLASGLRTFILTALFGAIAGFLSKELGSSLPLLAGMLVTAAAILSGYVLAAREREGIGLTTEFAGFAVFMLGALTMLEHRELAVGLGVIAATVLAYKQPLHGLVAKLGWLDVFAGLRLLLATFVVLPLLPDRTIDPLEALNPYKLWLLVILIAGLSLVGYVATRWLGSGRGTLLTALTGGLVSSTAVTMSLARRSREVPDLASLVTAGIVIAWIVMFVRVLVEVAVVNAALVPRLSIPLGAMAATAALSAALLYWRHGNGKGEAAEDIPLKNPFSLWAAVKFGILFAVILVLVKAVQIYMPGQGLYILAALAGLTDVDAITLSMADYARSGDPHTATTAIVIAAASNTLVKGGMVLALGDRTLRLPVLAATGAIVLAGGLATFLA